MHRSYLNIILRNFVKHRTYLIINILGLGLACACCIVAYINYDYAASFDSSFSQREKIFRVNREWVTLGKKVRNGQAPVPIIEHIKQDIPQVEHVVPYVPLVVNVRTEDDIFNTSILFAGSAFFNIFSYEFSYGTGTEIDKASNIVISDELSLKYFGNKEPLGQQITIVLPGRSVEYIVAGVFKKKSLNSSIQTDAIVHFDNYLHLDDDLNMNDWRLNVTIFLTISDPSNASIVEHSLQQYIEIENQVNGSETEGYYLDPFLGMSSRAREVEVQRHKLKGGMKQMQIYTPAILSLAILLVACFNFTNTSIAISANRLKEIGVRKVLGSSKRQLIFQFLAENIIVAMLGLLAGIIIAYLLVPAYSNMFPFLDLDIGFMHNTDLLIFLFVLLLLTALLSGGYPAFYISSFHPAIIFKGTMKFSGTNFFTRGLLFVQFTLCIMALVMGFSFLENAKYQEELDLGFEVDGVLIYEMYSKEYYEVFRNDLLSNPEVLGITGVAHHLWWSYYNPIVRHGRDETETLTLKVSDDYLDLMGFHLMEGRDFIKGSKTDEDESVIVNETFAKTFGWETAIGKRILVRDTVPLYVVGVVKDFQTNHVWKDLAPVMFRLYRPEDINFMIIRTNPEQTREVERFCKDLFYSRFPDLSYVGGIMTDELEGNKSANANATQIFLFLGIMALVLTTMGLYSLVSLNIIKRLKEIGIRKVFGASEWQIVQNINREFVILLTISMAVGLPLAKRVTLFLMESSWSYFLGTTLTTMLLSVLVIFIVAGITLVLKVVGAARANPVDTLRSE